MTTVWGVVAEFGRLNVVTAVALASEPGGFADMTVSSAVDAHDDERWCRIYRQKVYLADIGCLMSAQSTFAVELSTKTDLVDVPNNPGGVRSADYA